MRRRPDAVVDVRRQPTSMKPHGRDGQKCKTNATFLTVLFYWFYNIELFSLKMCYLCKRSGLIIIEDEHIDIYIFFSASISIIVTTDR